VLPAFEISGSDAKEGAAECRSASQIDDPIERAQMMREFERSLSAPAAMCFSAALNAQHTSR
jgi:uncharacterized protein (DUF2126 family)